MSCAAVKILTSTSASEEQRSYEEPGAASFTQIALQTKQTRKTGDLVQEELDWYKKGGNRGRHTEIAKRPVNVFAPEQSRNKRQIFAKKYEEYDQSAEIT